LNLRKVIFGQFSGSRTGSEARGYLFVF